MDELDLLRPIYRKTAAYGHFGREDAEFTWEQTVRVDDIKKYLGIWSIFNSYIHYQYRLKSALLGNGAYKEI